MSKKKINLFIPGKKRPNLISLFSKYIARKLNEDDKKLEMYCELFPFLSQWAVSLEEAELILQYYGYIDNHGNIINNSKNSKHLDLDIDDEYWTEYEELHPTDDDDDDDVPPDVVYPDDYWAELEDDYRKRSGFGEGRKGKHKHRKHRSKKNTSIDINTPYSGYEENPDELGSVAQHIYYYPDYTDKTDRLEFNNLKEFDDFCVNNDFGVPPYIGERIAYRPVSHCCLNPLSKSRGIKEIMAEESYADMMFEASEILELTH